MHAVFCEPPARPSARKRLPLKKSLFENVSLVYKSLKAISKNPHAKNPHTKTNTNSNTNTNTNTNTNANTTSLLPESP